MVVHHVRHIRRKVRPDDIESPPPATATLVVTSAPAEKKKIKNIYYDPATQEIVIEVED